MAKLARKPVTTTSSVGAALVALDALVVLDDMAGLAVVDAFGAVCVSEGACACTALAMRAHVHVVVTSATDRIFLDLLMTIILSHPRIA